MNFLHIDKHWRRLIGLVFVCMSACNGGGAAGSQRIIADITYPNGMSTLSDQLAVEANLYSDSSLSSASRVDGPIAGVASKADHSQFTFTFDSVDDGPYYFEIVFRQSTTAKRVSGLQRAIPSADNLAACPAPVVDRVLDYCVAADIWQHCAHTLATECERYSRGDAALAKSVASTTANSTSCEDALWAQMQPACEAQNADIVALCHQSIHDECANDSTNTSSSATSQKSTATVVSTAPVLASVLAFVVIKSGEDAQATFPSTSFNLNYDDNHDGVLNLSEVTNISVTNTNGSQPTPSPSSSLSPSASPSPTTSSSPQPTASAASSPSPTPTSSVSPAVSASPVASSSPQPTASVSNSPSPSPTPTSSPAATPTNSSLALTWTLQDSSAVVDLKDIAYGNGTFVGVGDYGNIITSSDGQQWTLVRSGNENDYLEEIIFGAGEFFTVHESAVYRSNDGKTWTDKELATGFYIASMAANADRVVAVGSIYPGVLHLVLYQAKMGWQYLSNVVSYNLNDVTWGGGQFVAVGDNGAILTSDDGITWTTQKSGVFSTLNSVTYHNGAFFIYESSTSLLTSKDGKLWSSVKPSIALNLPYGSHFTSHGGLMCVRGHDAIYTSLDGTVWTKYEIKLPAKYPKNILFSTVAWDGKTLAVVGDYGVVLTAPWSGVPAQ